jgi:hypothetical protein
MTLDEAWTKIGEACYAYADESARHALMVVRADFGEKNHIIGMLKWTLLESSKIREV